MVVGQAARPVVKLVIFCTPAPLVAEPHLGAEALPPAWSTSRPKTPLKLLTFLPLVVPEPFSLVILLAWAFRVAPLVWRRAR